MNNNQQVDVLFVVSPTNAREPYMPFYYLYLAGYLEKHGFTVEISNPHEVRCEDNVAIILRDVQRFQPRFVGLAAFVTDYDALVDLAGRIRQMYNGTILVGNAHASISPQDFLFENSPFDVVVRGEGELTVREILETYESHGTNDHIKGIVYRQDSRLVQTPNRELMDLNECGMPAYHKIDMAWYAQPSKLIIRRLAMIGAVIYTGRGCPFQCTFCASNSVWQANDRGAGGPRVRKRPMAHVIADLRMLQDRYGFDFFYILDDTFGVAEQDIIDFCAAYRESGLTMLWGAETLVRRIHQEDIVKLLKESGCIQLDFGVETGSERLLKVIKKRNSVEEIIRAFDLCRKYGIRTQANILLNLPTETDEDLASTTRLLKRIRPSNIVIGVTQPYPGTEIFRNLGRPIAREEYHQLSRVLPPEKFRLSSHRQDLHKLLFFWQLRYGIVSSVEISYIRADWRYWSHLRHSQHRWRYLAYLVRDNALMPIRFLREVSRYFWSRRGGLHL
jgi:anaerobic magnesium-protoporphyrin IX monomethyl ester cyclase